MQILYRLSITKDLLRFKSVKMALMFRQTISRIRPFVHRHSMSTKTPNTTTALDDFFNSVVSHAPAGLAYTSTSPVSFQVVFPGGFDYNSFNAKAMLQPWSVMRAVECSRAVGMFAGMPSSKSKDAVGQEAFMDFDKLRSDVLALFAVSTTMNFQPEIYNPNVDKRPITLNNEVAHIGHSSVKIITDVTFPGHHQRKPLVEMETGYVFLDTETHKPKASEAWWREKYLPHMRDGESPLRIPKLEGPTCGESVTHHHIMVMPSNLNAALHMQMSDWVKHCVDVYTIHYFKQHRGSGGSSHSSSSTTWNPFRNVKSVSVNYWGEGTLGDVIDMKWWISSTDMNSCGFMFLKEGKLVCDCRLELFDNR